MMSVRAQRDWRPARRAFLVGSALGFLTLLVCLAQPLFEFVNTVEANKVLRSVHAADMIRGRLLIEIVWFAIALISVHIVLGIIAASVALITCSAFRSIREVPPAKLTAVWYIAILGWIIGANSVWFPWSNAGAYYAGHFRIEIAGFSFFHIYSFALACALGAVFVATCSKVTQVARPTRRLAAVAALLVCAGLLAGISGSTAVNAASTMNAARPNVVIVGIDSLRLEQLEAFGGGGITPNIDKVVSSSFLFRDAVTPIARTFPSWISILSGRYPDKTGARVNLIDRRAVHAEPTLAAALREHGYNTLFATDEVRFSNIDESYGFDQVITPKIGAADFLLGMFNDFPVSNMVANSRLARLIFPHTYSNRAAASRYVPETFVEMLDRELHPRGPAFVAIHLTMAHWPYLWADAPKPPRGLSNQEAELWVYRNGLEVADRQFGEIVALLRERGILDNAIVVVLSDHGEALLQPGDRLIPKSLEEISGATRPVEVSTFGHGSSVLSPVQFQVLFAVSGTGSARPLVRAPGSSEYPASMVDVAPTLLNILGIGDPAHFDGVDLLHVDETSAADRVRFTETEFNLPMELAGQPDPAALALQGAEYYLVDELSGWLEFRSEKLIEIDRRRERAALSGNHILAALPTLDGQSRFVFADRKTGAAKLVQSDEHLPENAKHLWNALHEKYAEFLGDPST